MLHRDRIITLDPCIMDDMSDRHSRLVAHLIKPIFNLVKGIGVCISTVSEHVESLQGTGLVAQIVDLCKDCLCEAGRPRDGASYLLARLLTRPDMEEDTLVDFLQWSDRILRTTTNTFVSAFAPFAHRLLSTASHCVTLSRYAIMDHCCTVHHSRALKQCHCTDVECFLSGSAPRLMECLFTVVQDYSRAFAALCNMDRENVH